MLNHYLEEQQEQRSLQAKDEYYETGETIEFQAREDALQGASPHPEHFLDQRYWKAYCEGLQAHYCRKYQKFPQSVIFNSEHLF